MIEVEYHPSTTQSRLVVALAMYAAGVPGTSAEEYLALADKFLAALPRSDTEWWSLMHVRHVEKPPPLPLEDPE